MAKKPKIGFIGLGMLGNPMAKRVFDGGYELVVNDIRPEAIEDLVKYGANSAYSAKEVVKQTDIVITSLPTLKASEDVFLGKDGLIAGGQKGQIFIETSTVAPGLVKKFYKKAQKKGIAVVDAAIQSRSTFHPGLLKLKANEAAAKGLMTVQVGGDKNIVGKVKPVLSTFGNPVLHLGPIGSGTTTKVIQNAIAHANFCIACEALSVAVKAGVDLKTFVDLAGRVCSRSWITEEIIPQYLEKGVGRMMRTEVVVKDGQSMLELGRELGVPLLMQSIKHSYYEWANHSGLKDRSWDEMLQLWEGVIGKKIRY